MKWITLAVAIVAVLALVAVPSVVFAQEPVVSLTVVAPDGSALANATVKLIDVTGTEYSNTTGATGKVSITVPATGLYYVLVYGQGYYILSVLNVTGNISAVINASTMPALSVQSTGASVEFSIARSEIALAFKLGTNATIYTDPGKTVTLEFPREVLKFPYKYTLQKITYDTIETTDNTMELAPATNTTVIVHYSKTLYFMLPTWAIIALGVTVVVAIGVVWFATKTGKHVVASIRDNAMLFVKRKRFATRKEDEW